MCVCVCVFTVHVLFNIGLNLSIDNYLKYRKEGLYLYCDGKLTKIPKRDFIFARVKTGQVGT